MADTNSRDAQKLTDGMDSGSVEEKVKRQVFSASSGLCAAPNCPNHLHENKTRLGECAHILPRKIGSNPREDYMTPLADRKLESNLVYLCEKHHKLIDNPELKEQYTADILRKWKQDHETWTANNRKDGTFLTPHVEAQLAQLLDGIRKNSAKALENSTELLSSILNATSEYLAQGKNLQASALLSHVEFLLPDFGNPELVERSEVLSALLSFRSEDVHSAKRRLADFIATHSEAHDAMIEYILICDTAPEPGDLSEQFEMIVRELLPQDARLTILDTVRATRNVEQAKQIAAMQHVEIENAHLRLRYYIQKIVLFDVAGEYTKRDELLAQAIAEFPTSIKPDLFRFIFSSVDARRAEPDIEQLKACLELSAELRTSAKAKDPTLRRDGIAWDYHELILRYEISRLYASDIEFVDFVGQLLDDLSQCFMDRNLILIVNDIFSFIRVPEPKLFPLLGKIRQSKVKKSPTFCRHLFLQCLPHENCSSVLLEILKETDHTDLIALFSAVKESDGAQIVKIVNEIASDDFSVSLLSFLPENLVSEVAPKLAVGVDMLLGVKFAQIEALAKAGNQDEAVRIIASLDIGAMLPTPLLHIVRIAWDKKAWRLFIPAARRLCEFDIPDYFKTELHFKLAIALQQEGDDKNAIVFAEKALNNRKDLHDANVETLVIVYARSQQLLGFNSEAAEVFSKHSVTPSFALNLTAAQMLLRTDRENKVREAEQKVVEGFMLCKKFDDKTFVSAFQILNEVNRGGILGLPEIVNDCYVKIEGLDWIYVGDASRAMGAMPLSSGINYDAIIGKAYPDTISWPPDKFSKPGKTRNIIHILSAIGYLSARAHEGLENLADQGNEAVWSVQALKEDGSFDRENFTAFLEEKFKKSTDFFNTYCENTLPFGFLASVERDVARAIGKIAAEGKGFIRCNDGSIGDIERQRAAATDALRGAPCVIDGISALVLTEGNLLDATVQALPHLEVPISVIKYLRKFALDLDPFTTSMGKGSYAGGHFKFFSRELEPETDLRTKLIKAAEILDGLPNKTIGDVVEIASDQSLQHNTPPCLFDPLQSASNKGALLLSDDCVMLKAYEVVEQKPTPQQFSSLALSEVLHQEGKISYAAYLNFRALLGSYRYHLLPISADILFEAIMPRSPAGLVAFEPRNIEAFRLRLTLSQSYGVPEPLALKIISEFLSRIIKDDTISEDPADTVFAYTIVNFFGVEECRQQAEAILQVCRKMTESRWQSKLAQRKLEILRRQLLRFTETYDPLIASMPVLMKVVRSPTIELPD